MSLTSDDKIPLNGLHQSQRVDLYRSPFPLFNISAIWVSLQLTLKLMCVEELECLRPPEERVGDSYQLKRVHHTKMCTNSWKQNVCKATDLLPLPLPLGKSCTLTGNCSIWLRQLFILCTMAK